MGMRDGAGLRAVEFYSGIGGMYSLVLSVQGSWTYIELNVGISNVRKLHEVRFRCSNERMFHSSGSSLCRDALWAPTGMP